MKKFLTTLLLLACSFQVLADNLSDSNKLFDWAEQNYPQYFSPLEVETKSLDIYLVRYYEDTNIYLGTSGEDVYVYGEVFGGLLKVGKMVDFIQISYEPFTSDMTQNKTYYAINVDNNYRYTIEFNENSFKHTSEDGSFEGEYIIESNGLINTGSNGSPTLGLRYTSNPDYYLIHEIRGTENSSIEGSRFYFDEAKANEYYNQLWK